MNHGNEDDLTVPYVTVQRLVYQGVEGELASTFKSISSIMEINSFTLKTSLKKKSSDLLIMNSSHLTLVSNGQKLQTTEG